MLVLRTFRNPDLAIDLGSAAVRVGISRAPAHVQRPARVGQVAAVRNGVVVDPEVAAEVLRGLFRRFQRVYYRGARALACAPSNASASEREVIRQAVCMAGADDVYIAPEPLAAAIGTGVDVAAPDASLVIDMGEGLTDCAVIAEGRILSSTAVRGGCCALRQSIQDAVEERLGVQLSEDEAERLMRQVGMPDTNRPANYSVTAVATIPGGVLAKKHTVHASIVSSAIAEVAGKALDAAAEFVQSLDDRRGAEILETGVVLTGGGALVPGMAWHLETRLKMPVRVASAPLESVIRGAREMLSVAAAAKLWKH